MCHSKLVIGIRDSMMTTELGFSHFKTLILHIPPPIWLDVVPSRTLMEL